MVGRLFAVFTAVEVKTKGVKTTKPQENFIAMVEKFGGIALVAKKFEEVKQKIEDFKRGRDV
jgi:hypothetical protein